MWYEILPGLGLMVGLITVSGAANYYLQKFRHGGKLERDIRSRFDWHLKKRDEKLAGQFYNVKGLEWLPEKSP
ncbi:NADH dehydrogenase [ubiquinone] 1 alpha subcomplex subunit 1 [Holothuria leucospilota]|uniref:NADH dehydrogenase [ubiquinone] 1 alpha subcomplex subunit 1 n=1 Tax=Holothuria leucospilota TaxID=206669 RepID=A0A9Q1BQM6_HOLLE|nr:NADH dehydrogenase [ubiquinone] 1 alpha subcomplex subunit 1 [Holothuria leucospilota]